MDEVDQGVPAAALGVQVCDVWVLARVVVHMESVADSPPLVSPR